MLTGRLAGRQPHSQTYALGGNLPFAIDAFAVSRRFVRRYSVRNFFQIDLRVVRLVRHARHFGKNFSSKLRYYALTFHNTLRNNVLAVFALARDNRNDESNGKIVPYTRLYYNRFDERKLTNNFYLNKKFRSGMLRKLQRNNCRKLSCGFDTCFRAGIQHLAAALNVGFAFEFDF